jgi:hypothetical protein
MVVNLRVFKDHPLRSTVRHDVTSSFTAPLSRTFNGRDTISLKYIPLEILVSEIAP